MSPRLAALLFCLVASCALPRGAAADAPPGPRASLRVLTYNVLADPVHVEQRAPELLRLMREADADIIALQEVAPWLARLLLEEHWVPVSVISIIGDTPAPGTRRHVFPSDHFGVLAAFARVDLVPSPVEP